MLNIHGLHNPAGLPIGRTSVWAAKPAAYAHFRASMRLSVFQIMALGDIRLPVHLFVAVCRWRQGLMEAHCILGAISLSLGAGEVGGQAAEIEAKLVGDIAIEQGGKGEATGADEADVHFEDAVWVES